MLDGVIKLAFDKIKIARGYTEYNQVLRDIIIEGINKIIIDSKQGNNFKKGN